MWYYVENGERRGPVTDADLESLCKAGTVEPETLVWREGMANWQPYREAVPGVGGGTPAGAGTEIKTGIGEVVCSECGKAFAASDVIRYGNAAVCADCKPIFVQKLKEGAKVGGGAMEYATFGTRFGAYFLDGIITGIGGAAIGGGIGFIFRGAGTTQPLMISLVAMAAGFLMRMAYFTFFIGKFGATPGKMACKIKVVNADGSPVGYGKACGRFFGYLLSSAILAIGFLMAAWDEEKRALHDRLCNTRVVKL